MLHRWVRPQDARKGTVKCQLWRAKPFHLDQVRVSVMIIFIITASFNKKLIPSLSSSTSQKQEIIHTIANFGQFFSLQVFGCDGAPNSDFWPVLF